MKIAISGGTGFIGGHLIQKLIRNNHELIVISRRERRQQHPSVVYMTWHQLEREPKLLEGLEAIVNLAGQSINRLWTTKGKELILQSRISVVKQIHRLVAQLEQKPRAIISATGMSIYGTSETEVFDETSPANVSDFLSGVVDQWEHELDRIEGPRIVKLRIGLVLSNDGGALPKLMLPYKLGIGGKVGSGKQWVSWIHIADMVSLIEFCIHNEDVRGPVNAASPAALTNDDFGRALGKALHRPHYFPVPAFVLKIIFGELSDVFLKGQRVKPQALLDYGFTFAYPSIEEALDELL